MPITINTPPCSGGTVAPDFTYSGTYDLTKFKPKIEKPLETVVVVVKVTLVIGNKDSDGTSQTLGPYDANLPAAGTWSYPFANVPAGRNATITAALHVDDAAPVPTSVSDFIVRSGGGDTSSCFELPGDGEVGGDGVVAAAGAAVATGADGQAGMAAAAANAVGRAVANLVAPAGYTLQLLTGTYPNVPSSPLAFVRCRIEKRPNNVGTGLRRVTLTASSAVIFFNGVWMAPILVPTNRDPAYHYRFVAEFFDVNGLLFQTADVRNI